MLSLFCPNVFVCFGVYISFRTRTPAPTIFTVGSVICLKTSGLCCAVFAVQPAMAKHTETRGKGRLTEGVWNESGYVQGKGSR